MPGRTKHLKFPTTKSGVWGVSSRRRTRKIPLRSNINNRFILHLHTASTDLGVFYPSPNAPNAAARTIDSGRRRIRPLYGANGYISILLEANRNGDL